MGPASSVLDDVDDRASRVSGWTQEGRDAGARIVFADAVLHDSDWPGAGRRDRARGPGEPGRVRVAGEVDFSNVDLVQIVLSRATPVAGRLVLDLSEPSFVDVAGTARIVDAVRRLRVEARAEVEVVGPPPAFRTIVEATGWGKDVGMTAGGR